MLCFQKEAIRVNGFFLFFNLKFFPVKIIAMLCLFCGSFLFAQHKETNSSKKNIKISAKVIGIKDGDTIEVLYHELPLTIRLDHIDAPEIKGSQPFCKASKKKLSELCFGEIVLIQSKSGFDRNGRIIAEIFTSDGKNINKEMVQLGYAWHYTKYSDDILYQNLQHEAQAQKRGLWADKSAVAPWKFRSKK